MWLWNVINVTNLIPLCVLLDPMLHPLHFTSFLNLCFWGRENFQLFASSQEKRFLGISWGTSDSQQSRCGEGQACSEPPVQLTLHDTAPFPEGLPTLPQVWGRGSVPRKFHWDSWHLTPVPVLTKRGVVFLWRYAASDPNEKILGVEFQTEWEPFSRTWNHLVYLCTPPTQSTPNIEGYR